MDISAERIRALREASRYGRHARRAAVFFGVFGVGLGGLFAVLGLSDGLGLGATLGLGGIVLVFFALVGWLFDTWVDRSNRLRIWMALDRLEYASPVLTFETVRTGLVFFDANGYFVERDLAFSPYATPSAGILDVRYRRDRHHLEVAAKVHRYQKKIVFELPSSLDPSSVESAASKIRNCLRTPHE